MTDTASSLSPVRKMISDVRGFGSLWVALASLGGFAVLIGGPAALRILIGIFGARGENPWWVITVLLVATLPIAIYVWLQQRKLEAEQIACEQCGERYAFESSKCPTCGAENPKSNSNSSA